MKKILFALLALSSSAFADTGFSSTIRVSEADGAPACTVGQVKFSNGSVTCSGQSASVTSGGGSLSGPQTFSSSATFNAGAVFNSDIGMSTQSATSGTPKLWICGYNATDNSTQCGYLQSSYIGASGNLILFAVDSSSANARLQVQNVNRHLGIAISNVASSQFTFEAMQTYDTDYDGVFSIRAAEGASGGDTNGRLRLFMNTAGATLTTLKGRITLIPYTRNTVVVGSVTVQGGDVNVSSPTFGYVFSDATRQLTAANFNRIFNPDQAKLPGSSPCAISNSTLSVTSSLLCDAATNESVTYSTVLTPYVSSSLKVDIQYSMVSATSGDVVLISSVACITPGDSQDVDTKTFGTGASVTSTVPGTAGYMKSATITGINDSCASGDLLAVYIERTGAAAGDTATGDIEIRKIRVYE